MLDFPTGATITQHPTKESWLDYRRTRIGGSTMADLFADEIDEIARENDQPGIGGTFGSPYAVWCDLSGVPRDPTPPNQRMVIGSCLERGIAQIYSEMHGVALTDLGRWTTVQHPTIPWAYVSLDFVVQGECGLLEVKNVGWEYSDAWESGVWGSGGRAPLRVVIQGSDQLLVTGAPWVDLFGLVGGNDPRTVRVYRDEELIADIIAKGNEMMDRVRRGDPPPIDGREASRKAQRRRWSSHVVDSFVALDESAGEQLAERRRLLDQIDDIGMEVQRIENRLVEPIQHHQRGIVPGWGPITSKTPKNGAQRSFSFPRKPNPKKAAAMLATMS